ncbi:RDD family protein [Ornithinimicrobium tianjinense]|uniref:RDD family protein n=1 Tax=Ornithinimicrobium tianjinense TaxID=1195761 RepID=A0A917BMJ9_9MICO|nr:RDD family protein [Ornithinimicrobium tianjinense]GGF50677.1 hypothetical protein GCM10011366_18120 [Ornithinimicrobium tianjinense]
MSQQAGWYDDPQNAENLRYWDGVQWTNHTSPKQKPDLDRAGAPAQEAYGQPGGPFAGQQQQGQPYGQQQYGQYGQNNPYAGQTGQQPYQAMPGGFATQTDERTRTPDGQPLAGWWHRVGARLLDSIVIAIVGGLVANTLVPGVWADYTDWALSATDPAAQPPAELMGRVAQWSLVLAVVGFVYEVVMVALVGGTLGKLMTGLRVRLRDQPGLPGWGAALIRSLVYQLSGVFAPVYLLNVLWPLWDGKRQALHDKAAKTNVVKKR